MNVCMLIGNLGADPESFFTDEGTHIVNFSLAFKSTKKEKTNWVKIVSFNKQAEAAQTYLHKGARIAVLGRLDQNKWVDEENKTRSTLRLIANQITFLKTDGRGFTDENQNEAQPEMEDIPF